MIKDTFLKPLVWFVYSAIATTGLCGILYVSMQQSFRQNLDDPQIQIAEDAARALAGGAAPASVMPLVANQPGARTPSVNLQSSLSPWVAVYDAARTPLESSGVLDNAPPVPPPGTFDTSTWLPQKTYTTDVGLETRFTWAPAGGTRQAVVLIKLTKPAGSAVYVAVGRNMREIESRIEDVGAKIFFAWVVILGTQFVASIAAWILLKRPE